MDMRIIFLVVFALFSCKTMGKFIMKPRNIDAKINQTVYFNCSTDDENKTIHWLYGRTQFENLNEQYREYGNMKWFYNNIYSFNGTHHNDFVIRSIKTGDEGNYTCYQDLSSSYTAQLNILSDDPKCESKIETEIINLNVITYFNVELKCSVDFHGNAPQLKWKKNGMSNFTFPKESISISGHHFVSTLKFENNTFDNAFYTCETTQTIAEPIKCIANTIDILAFIEKLTNKDVMTISDHKKCATCSYAKSIITSMTITLLIIAALICLFILWRKRNVLMNKSKKETAKSKKEIVVQNHEDIELVDKIPV